MHAEDLFSGDETRRSIRPTLLGRNNEKGAGELLQRRGPIFQFSFATLIPFNRFLRFVICVLRFGLAAFSRHYSIVTDAFLGKGNPDIGHIKSSRKLVSRNKSRHLSTYSGIFGGT
jgi:hypothetical protein